MKQIFRNSTHVRCKSHDCLIAEIKGKKIKITYEAYNASEKCDTYLFDGYKWNHIISMLDMGFQPNNSIYVWDDNKRKERADDLFKKAEIMCKGII